MPTIGSLLDEQQRKRLADVQIVVTKRACDPNPPRRALTAADAIEIDPESEAMIVARCVDYAICESTVLIEPRTPEGVDPETPRIPICRECHGIRERDAKASGTFVRRVVRVQTPVQIQEPPVIDLNNVPAAVLGEQLRESMAREIAEAVPAKRKKAKKKQAKREAKEKAALEAERATRQGVVLPGFTLHGIEVPALDLSAVRDMNEIVSAQERSPYNKALYRNGEPTLPAGDPDDSVAPSATYADLEQTHRRLSQSQPVLVADLDPEVPAKVRALMDVMPHLSKKQAKAILASV